jgi:hypothetical protein
VGRWRLARQQRGGSRWHVDHSYTGRYRSSKLAFGAKAGTAMAQQGRPVSIAFLLLDSVTSGIRFGGRFSDVEGVMDGVATYLEEDGGDGVDQVVVYDSGPDLIDATTSFIPMPNATSNDPRVCLQFDAPFPVTLQGYIIGHHLDEKVKA